MTDFNSDARSTPSSAQHQTFPEQTLDVTEKNSTKSGDDALHDLEKGSASTVPPEGTDRFFVEFDGPNDPDNPKNWTPKRRWGITVSMGLMVFTVTFASSIFSVTIGIVQEKFNVEKVTATLGVALFVLVRYGPSPLLAD
jgi:DHA1 family multidrug resistance protein-like MFS transporter